MRDAPKKKKAKEQPQEENFVSYFVQHCLRKYFKSKKHMASAIGMGYRRVLDVTNEKQPSKGSSLVFQELVIYCVVNGHSLDEIAWEYSRQQVEYLSNTNLLREAITSQYRCLVTLVEQLITVKADSGLWESMSGLFKCMHLLCGDCNNNQLVSIESDICLVQQVYRGVADKLKDMSADFEKQVL